MEAARTARDDRRDHGGKEAKKVLFRWFPVSFPSLPFSDSCYSWCSLIALHQMRKQQHRMLKKQQREYKKEIKRIGRTISKGNKSIQRKQCRVRLRDCAVVDCMPTAALPYRRSFVRTDV